MKDIAFHITDIAENSLRAQAHRVEVALTLDHQRLTLVITDDGRGMDPETLHRATDPFYTTRTTRRAGLGLPFLFQNATQCGGEAEVHSTVGEGTVVRAVFALEHIDCPPTGDLGTTLGLLIACNPTVETVVTLASADRRFSLRTSEIQEALGDIPSGHPQVVAAVSGMVAEGVVEVFGNRLI